MIDAILCMNLKSLTLQRRDKLITTHLTNIYNVNASESTDGKIRLDVRNTRRRDHDHVLMLQV